MKPEVEFSDCMCLSIRKASRNITQAYNEEFQGLGINITQFSVLAILFGMPCIQSGAEAFHRNSKRNALKNIQKHGKHENSPPLELKAYVQNPMLQSKKHNPLQKSAEMHIDKEVEMTANK